MSTPVVGNEEEVTGDGITTGIIEISESDVLCGRGGAALRHPGNQTYRRLVNLNKGLYITCLKTEKLKISRSIVAAIREQKGRFLEKETETSFYDIGDKKAIEKTSQALREGQPKLRQKIVEMGGAAAMESQYGHAGVYPEQVGLVADPSILQMPPPQPVQPLQQQQQQQQLSNQHPLQQLQVQTQAQRIAVAAAQNAVLRQEQLQNMQQVPQPDPGRLSMHEELFQRLSVRDLHTQDDSLPHPAQQLQYTSQPQIQHPHLQSQQHMYQQQQQLMYQQQIQQQQLNQLLASEQVQQQQPQQRTSLLSNFSSVSSIPHEADKILLSSVDSASLDRILGNANQPSPTGPIGSEFYRSQQDVDPRQSRSSYDSGSDHMNISGHEPLTPTSSNTRLEDKLAQDRRKVYARMKYAPGRTALPASSNHSMGDGMPDFHMVESSQSLFSTLSAMTDGKSEHLKASTAGGVGAFRPKPETVKVVDHSAARASNNMFRLDRNSGHSVMSVSSIDSNLFADFKKTMSTHSIGELSIFQKMDKSTGDDEDDTDGFGQRLDEAGAII